MMHLRLRLIELGLLAALGLTQAPHVAAADPRPPATADERDLNYVYFRDADHTSMSGDTKDIERARKFQQGKQPVLWFRDSGQEYIVRDPDTLVQLDAIWKSVRETGDAQGKLGTQMGELGTQQGQIGSHQGLIGTRQGTLAIREAALDMRASNDALSPADKAELDKQRRALRQHQRDLDKEMRALEPPMKALGDQMAVLGRQMEALGQKMEAASHKAMAETRAMLRRAIAAGLAKPAR
ncbi:MAG: hypothetical protein ABIY55_03620 [Kofleriaceae bacterium]